MHIYDMGGPKRGGPQLKWSAWDLLSSPCAGKRQYKLVGAQRCWDYGVQFQASMELGIIINLGRKGGLLKWKEWK